MPRTPDSTLVARSRCFAVRATLACVGFALAISGLASCGTSFQDDAPRLLVIGMDGLDHKLMEQWMNEGKLPNFARLRDAGGFRPLTTSIPPESPVAWSNLSRGMNPGGHGVKDFFKIDPKYLTNDEENEDGEPIAPADGLRDSVSITTGELVEWQVGSYKIPSPFGAPETKNDAAGTTFWEVLEKNRIPATVNRMPANFPPVATQQKTLTGMGTPELSGSTEAYALYTDNLPANRNSLGGGKAYRVRPRDGIVKATLYGPPQFRVGEEQEDDGDEAESDDESEDSEDESYEPPSPPSECEFTVYYDTDSSSAKIVVGEEIVVVNVGEWSRWVSVEFELFPMMVNVGGICRFLVQEIEPDFRLYVSSVNFDPKAPAAQISTPDDYAAELAERIGPYHTKGLPVEYKALKDGALRLGDFVKQMEWQRDEELAILHSELERFESGMLFCYLSHTDLPVHNLWNTWDPDSPTYDADTAEEFGDTVESIYRGADATLGKVLAWIERNPDVTLLVVSDHGMGPYHRAFNLNTWLYENGYLVLNPKPESQDERMAAVTRKRLEALNYVQTSDEEGADDEDGGESENDGEPKPGPGVGVLTRSIDWSKTRAYGFGFAGIFLNLQGREADGIVTEEQQSALLEEIRQKLLAVEDPENGQRVFKYIYRADDVYSGDQVGAGPDLIVGTYRGYRVSDDSAQGNLPEGILFDNQDPWSGDHSTMAHDEVPGILFSNRPIAAAAPALYDITSTILAYYGIENQEGMIGKSVLPPGTP